MENAEFQELKTARLVLRRLRPGDAENFFMFAGSNAVTRYMLWKPHRDVSESVASIEKTLARYEAGTCYRWAIALAETDKLIGIIDLLGFSEAENSCSFAYMLAEEFWGKGYGTEALKAVLEFAFTCLKVAVVEADHFAENGASGAVMQKVGMVPCGTVPEKYEKDGIVHDAVQYRITRERWKNTIS